MPRIVYALAICAIAAICAAEEAALPVAEETAPPTQSSRVEEPDYGLFISADYLNWQARGAIWSLSPVDEASPPYNIGLDSHHNSGVRAEIGYRFQSQWDLGWRYTHFDSQAAYGETPDYVGLAGNGLFRYDVHDLEIGHAFAPSSIDWRVFGGFRWAMLGLNRCAYYPPGNYGTTLQTRDYEANNLSAYGLGFGGEGRWRLGQTGLSLFARGAVYALVGFDSKRSLFGAQNTRTSAQSMHATETVPVIETAAGVSWRRGHWELSGGYEVNMWISTFHPMASGAWGYGLSDRQDLVLDGFFLRASFSR